MKSLSVAILACGAVLSAGAYAQTPTPAPTKDTGTPANKSPSGMPTDANFLKTMANGGMAEVEVGKLATEKAMNPDVKKFAQQMVDDHSKTNEKVKTLAKEKNVDLPAKPGPEHAAAKSKLEQQRGTSFDAEYMKAMVKNHQKTVQLLQHQISSGQDARVKSFAQEALPTVQHHLQMAKDLEAKVAGGSTERTSRTTQEERSAPRTQDADQSSSKAPVPNR
jgi:putative membrane protein